MIESDKPKKICQHCNKSTVSRPKGLCWKCYHTPGVAEMYKTLSKYANRGVGHFSGRARPASDPIHEPKTRQEKEKILAGRAERGEELFHPDDCRVLRGA